MCWEEKNYNEARILSARSRSIKFSKADDSLSKMTSEPVTHEALSLVAYTIQF